VTTSNATTETQAGLVDVATLAPDIDIEMRYAGTHNFTGGIVEGYGAPRCLLLRPAAEALARVQAALRPQRLRLRVYDCYRPVRAVQAFMRWVDDAESQATKREFYPDLEKAQLRGGYIAAVSAHSRGATTDLGLLQCNDANADCKPLDMGTPFDFFGERANTDFPGITDPQRANRQRLRAAMEHAGFANYPMEWWHYTLKPEPTPWLQYDVPIIHPDTTMLQAKVDHLMQRYDGDVPGASLLVLKDGEAVLRRGYGRADLEQGIEAGPATDYRLASVSKQFTAASILLLAQDGKLGIDDPLRKWLPSLPPAAAGITLRHVLTHTSGLVDYEDLMAADYRGQIRDAGVLELLAKENRLYFAPGSAYRYSNSGYALLSLVVERASGMDYPTFVHRRIFAPLGMHDTLAYVAGGPGVNHRAYGYSDIDGHWQRTDQSSTSAVLGDGGIYSSIDDLARWDAALYDNRLLSDASRALAFSQQVEVTGESYQAFYGFGWRISGDMLWHSGETMGFRNVILRWPKQRLTVILLSNRNDPEPYATAMEIAGLFMAE
jgi:CubicO group peptidase (beta-lactamase class C family)